MGGQEGVDQIGLNCCVRDIEYISGNSYEQ